MNYYKFYRYFAFVNLYFLMPFLELLHTEDQDISIKSDKTKKFVIFKANKTVYLLCYQTIHYAIKTIEIGEKNQSYICGCLRFVNLQHLSKLNKLLTSICTQFKDTHANQWLCLYEIISYEPKNMTKYRVANPVYGEQVQIKSNQKLNKIIFSNCFAIEGDYFYFIQQQNQKFRQQFDIILSLNSEQIYGVCIQVNGQLLCLPFCMILADMTPKLCINQKIESILRKTVYLQSDGSHSTGTLISKNRILTVRHLLSSKTPKIGTQINLRIYPYTHNQKAKLIKLFFDEIDLVQLQINDISIINNPSQSIDSTQGYYLHEEGYVKTTIGQQIKAVGFGKFNYSQNKFSQLQLLLPTISLGVISKEILVNNEKVVFKTDANLYNGFSGCGIWKGSHQVGVAVFIIKNTSTSDRLTKQNFSYFTSFIYHRLYKSRNIEFSKTQLQKIKNIQNFGVRQKMQIRPSL